METYWGIVSVFYLPKTKSVQEGNSIVRVYKRFVHVMWNEHSFTVKIESNGWKRLTNYMYYVCRNS